MALTAATVDMKKQKAQEIPYRIQQQAFIYELLEARMLLDNYIDVVYDLHINLTFFQI